MNTDAAAILTPFDIRSLRHYVHRKYADLPSDRKAEIVADAMKRIISRGLPEFPEEARKRLTSRLVREVVTAQQQPVSAEHIFSVCLEELGTELDEPAYFAPLHAWTEQRLAVLLEPETFRSMLDHIKASGCAESRDAPDLTPWRMLTLKAAALQILPAPNEQHAAAGQVVFLPIPSKPRQRSAMYVVLSLVLVAATFGYGVYMLAPGPSSRLQPPVGLKPVQRLPLPENSLPQELRYAEFDSERLLAFLKGKTSLLAEEPYYRTIVETAERYNIDPLFMFAITGQEQGFVPKANKQARIIANNPFNVFHSWKDYNTDIKDSAEIAARTIINLSKNRPSEVDGIEWINRKYAEDPHWSEGVRKIWTSMKQYVMAGSGS
jgi:hypothetical protein